MHEEMQPPAVLDQPIDALSSADLGNVSLIIEALLLAADGPMSIEQLIRLVGSEFGLGKREMRDALTLLSERQSSSASELVEVASGWRLQVRAHYSEWVSKLWQEKPPKYSRALLETLALIVYRQPITRGEIEDVRGVVVSSNILRTLQDRGWIRELGYKEVPGRPALFGSTAQFLDDFNVKSLSQLPSLPDVKDLEQMEKALTRLGAQALPPVEDDEGGDAGDDARSEAETDVAAASATSGSRPDALGGSFAETEDASTGEALVDEPAHTPEDTAPDRDTRKP